MTRYRRNFIEGGTFFFTLVTANRFPLFRDPGRIHLLRDVFANVRARWPMHIDAIVILPDHLHAIWTLPKRDSDYSVRWRLIKQEFSRRIQSTASRSSSRESRRERTVWQRRFWEHTIRCHEDLIRHMDYIHYNPAKHGYVDKPRDWPWSSLHREIKRGTYEPTWGEGEEPLAIRSMDPE